MPRRRKLLQIAALVAVAAGLVIFMYRRAYDAELEALSQGPEPGTALVERRLAEVMEGVREGTDTGELSRLVRPLGYQAVPFLDAYQDDPSEKVRRSVRTEYSGLLRSTTVPEKRQAMVERLIRGLDDVDGG